MTAIKPFTDIEQSKKLAEILPLKSADMYYLSGDEYDVYFGSGLYEEIADWYSDGTPKPADIPCWSFAALLKCLSEIKPQEYTFTLAFSEGKWGLCFIEYGRGCLANEINDNPVDACYEMIIKLHELNLL